MDTQEKPSPFNREFSRSYNAISDEPPTRDCTGQRLVTNDDGPVRMTPDEVTTKKGCDLRKRGWRRTGQHPKSPAILTTDQQFGGSSSPSAQEVPGHVADRGRLMLAGTDAGRLLVIRGRRRVADRHRLQEVPVLGNLQQRGPSSWRIRVFVGQDEASKKRYIERTSQGPTMLDPTRWWSQAQAERRSPLHSIRRTRRSLAGRQSSRAQWSSTFLLTVPTRSTSRSMRPRCS